MRRGAPARRPVSPPAKAEDALREQASIQAWVRILAVHKRALAAIRLDLEHEMTMPRFDLLANLTRTDGQTLAALSRTMLVTAGNLTGLVDRAARDGLVERRADPNDRRAWRVHLTAKGQRAFRDAERRHAARIAKVFAALAPAELTTLTRLLSKLRDTERAAAAPAARGTAPARARLARPARSATITRERRRKAPPDDEETNG